MRPGIGTLIATGVRGGGVASVVSAGGRILRMLDLDDHRAARQARELEVPAGVGGRAGQRRHAVADVGGPPEPRRQGPARRARARAPPDVPARRARCPRPRRRRGPGARSPARVATTPTPSPSASDPACRPRRRAPAAFPARPTPRTGRRDRVTATTSASAPSIDPARARLAAGRRRDQHARALDRRVAVIDDATGDRHSPAQAHRRQLQPLSRAAAPARPSDRGRCRRG